MLILDKLKKTYKYDNLQNVDNYHISQSRKFHSKLVNNNKKTIFFKDLYPNYTEMFSDVIIYVILVCNILTILFFTLVKDIEGEIVKQQINYLLDDIFPNVQINNKLNNINFIKDENIINILLTLQNNIKTNITSNFNKIGINEEIEIKIKQNNEEIFKKSMFALIILNISCFIILLILWKFNKYNFLYYLKKNLILGIFVIITELVFLYVISKKYIYIDKKYLIFETLKKINKNN